MRKGGAVYAFQKVDGEWTQTQKLIMSDAREFDQVGFKVWADDDLALVSSPVNDERGLDSGAVYALRRQGNQWVEFQKITGSGSKEEARFGFGGHLEGSTAIIGEIGTKSAYVFEFNGTTWDETQRIEPSEDPPGFSCFGASVGLEGNKAVIGDYHTDRAYTLD